MAAENRSLLIVDDDVDFLEAVRDTVAEEGYRPVEARDGGEALDYLRAHPTPAVILLDWNMAPMNGPQFMAEIAKDPVLARIPVVLLTADVKAMDKLKTASFADCLTKPVNLDALFETLARFCR